VTAPRSSDNRIVVVSGPSGSGKTTLVERLVANPPVRLVKAVSATTRPRREGEVHGESYFFLEPEEFERRRLADDFLEVAEVHGRGHWYGTLRTELERAWTNDAWSLLEIDVEGAVNVMRDYPSALTVFVRTPSDGEYERRLRGRATETEEVIQRRLETARRELALADRYKHVIVNDDLDRAVGELVNILTDWEAQHAG
jgi:guanylate kinase